MSGAIFRDWILLAVGAWLIQYLARALWAMVFGGPGATKFLIDQDRFRQNRPNYWAILTIVGGLLLVSVVGWVSTAAKLAGYRLSESPVLAAAAGFALCSLFAVASGWTLWASFGEWRRGLSGWLAMVLIAVVFLAMIAGCILAVALTFGFVE